MSPTPAFTDRIALVTGAGEGLGRATSRRLARDGFFAFLAGSKSSHVSGQVSYVDGGLSAGRPGG